MFNISEFVIYPPAAEAQFNRHVTNCVGNFLYRLSITSGFRINNKLSDILNTILYLEPIKRSHKLRCKQVKERKVLSLHGLYTA